VPFPASLGRKLRGVNRRGLGLSAAVIAFGLILVGVLWSVVLTEERSERDEVIAAAVKQHSNLAVAYEEHVVRTLAGLDSALLIVRQEYRRLGRALNIARYIDDGIIDERLSSSISITDERGNVVLSSRPMPAASYAEFEFFRVHQLRRGRDALHVGVPLAGRLSDAWQIPLSRPWFRADGGFGGVVVLSVDPGYFARFYRKIDLGAQGLVLLTGLDGVSRARRVGNVLSFGEDLGDSTLLHEQARSEFGSFLSQGGVDGVPRFVSYRTLADYPLVVAVGASRAEVLADVTRNRNRDYFVAALITMVIFVFTMALVVAVQRQERAAFKLATSEARFRATFEQAAIGICHTSLERRYIAVNRTFCEMLGYSRQELIGMPVWEIIHPEDRGDEPKFRDKLLSGEIESHAAEKRYVRKDGRVIWVNRTVSLVRDYAGEPLYFLRVVEDVTERKRLEQELQALAATDALTGLPNRRSFMARLEEEYARLRRFDTQQVAVLMLDLDNFKRINDTYGHAAGDEVLRQAATLIREEPRRVDLCARLGGEEFAVILAGASPDAAREFAERLRRKIAAAAIVFEGKALAVTVSIGVAAMRPTDESADVSLLRADAALYRAKDGGRNQVRLADEGDSAAGAAA
jgi:diguanylate cyclase (GGDEF)-like protein/PAS domain S-box-containing protein